MSLEKKLRVGDSVYYASTSKRVTIENLLFMNKSMYKDAYEAIEITPKVAERFKFIANETRTIFELKFNDQKIVTLYYPDTKNLEKIRLRNVTPTDAMKWDFSPMQMHELQQITDILLKQDYYD